MSASRSVKPRPYIARRRGMEHRALILPSGTLVTMKVSRHLDPRSLEALRALAVAADRMIRDGNS